LSALQRARPQAAGVEMLGGGVVMIVRAIDGTPLAEGLSRDGVANVEETLGGDTRDEIEVEV